MKERVEYKRKLRQTDEMNGLWMKNEQQSFEMTTIWGKQEMILISAAQLEITR
ncbi:hypothetical protein Plhal304r1_c020g0072781 [Plasmopara halstedii]